MKMTEMCNVSFKSSDQHITLKQAWPSHITHNDNDIEVMTKFCESLHPMQIDRKLKNIATRLIAPDKVNIVDDKSCGKIIISKMEDTSPLTYSFKRIM